MPRRAAFLLALAGAMLPAAALAQEVPTAQIGAQLRLGAGGPASLFRPTTLGATFRVPPAETALYLVTDWFTSDLHVTIVGPGAQRRTLVASNDLPGRTLGLRLPADAWRADRIELAATAVSAAAYVSLVPAEAFGAIAWRDWWRGALFGAFITVALAAAGLAARRPPGLIPLAVFAAANAALLAPGLGLGRAPPQVSQPLHALEAATALAALTLAVIAAGGSSLRLGVRRALWGAAAIEAIVVAGADVFQDWWPLSGVPAAAVELVVTLAFLAAALIALRGRAAGARFTVAATAVAAAGTIVAVFAPDATVAAAAATPLGAAAEALLLGIAFTAPTDRLGLRAIVDGSGLDAALERAHRAARRDGRPLGTLAVDLDQFARFNALQGHAAGDAALRSVAGALVRTAAGVESSVVARSGGDGFAVLLPNCAPPRARQIADDALAAIVALGIAHPGVPSHTLSASIGVAAYVGDGDDANAAALLVRAGTALAIAKAMGRNRVVVDEGTAFTEPVRFG